MKTEYKEKFLQTASYLDAMANGEGKISNLALKIVENKDEKSIFELYSRIVKIIEDKNLHSKIKTVALSLRESFVCFLGYDYLRNIIIKEKKLLKNIRRKRR